MKFAKHAILATALAATPFAASAQDLAAGAVVTGPEGNEVGTIESVENGQAILNTGKHQVPLPAAAFGAGDAGPTITVTKVQLNQLVDDQIAAASAQRDAALVAGAAVLTADGQSAGTIGEIDLAADSIVLEYSAGPIALKKEHFAVNAQQQLIALFTAAQLAQTVAGTQSGAE
ncbi:MAG: hypothetical protein ABJP48_11120 [Erythrobacter sp.]